MIKSKVLILNGPNLGHLGERQPEIYGAQSLALLPELVQKLIPQHGVDLVFFQSNHEGAIIDRLEQARNEGFIGIVLNAGAYTHTSLALADCLAWIKLPCVEVHISQVFARTEEPLRQQSLMGKHCVGIISGFGIGSYALAVQALVMRLYSSRQP